LALFGCISLFGQGWHSFLGHEFHGTAGCCHAHDHDDGAPHDHGDDAEHAGAIAAGHDCPICDFFAQAHWAVDHPPARFECAACGVPLAAERAAYLACVGLYRPRAPPSPAA
jgi:hypothetical protein